VSKAPPVHTSAGRELLEWVETRIRDLDTDEAHTAQRGALSAFRTMRQRLEEVVPYIEQGAICLVSPGVSHTSAASMLDLYDDRSAPIAPAA
jgi:hypothetical protein